jgi:NADH:ubiquinone oxidoreductase subunit 3 (subunit A)
VEILLFVAILMLGLVYAWAKGDLEWVKKVQEG